MNLLLIVADDLRADVVPYMPYVNGTLRRHGTTYTGMRCEVPACSPARAALSTGLHAFRAENGVYLNDVSDVTDPAVDALAPWLQDAGVYTALIGKYTIPGQNASPGGWDLFTHFTAGAQSPYGYTVRDAAGSDITPSPPRPHNLDYTRVAASAVITGAAEPWFLWWAPTNPHLDTATLAFSPLPASVDRFTWLDWDLDLLTDTTDKPSWIQALAQFSYADQSTIRRNIRQQVREARDLDTAIATLMADVDLGDTVVIFTSDSGVHYGEQRLGSVFCAGKGTPYDVAMRAPCIVAGPGFGGGATVETTCSLQDITATTVDIFDATPTVTLDGISLANTAGLAARPGILYEHNGAVTEFPLGLSQGVITPDGTRKLVRWNDTSPATDEFEAYDLDSDPTELLNWANDAGRLTERNALEAVLDGILAS